mmetsp:Transcript_10469/g.23770  ORF Transcript_10469/g.23770 Transcript_10469/m.23770 type:complete len:446 (+) Transcript_10469:148-1485(+)
MAPQASAAKQSVAVESPSRPPADIALLAGGQKFLAHQAELAKAGNSFQELITDAKKASDSAGKTSSILALELAGISKPEALKWMLEHVYSPAKDYRPSSEEVNRQVLALAVGFEMEGLYQRVAQWMASKVTAKNVQERMDNCDEMGLTDLATDIYTQLTFSSTPRAQKRGREDAASEQQEAPAVAPAAPAAKPKATRKKRAAAGEKAAAQADALDVEELCGSDSAERKIAVASFAEQAVPGSVAPKKSLTQYEARVAAKLSRCFEERAAWLPAPLGEALGLSTEAAAVQKLLPYYCYLWNDGPWQGSYARLGWDPRLASQESKDLQVVKFSDPYFSTMEYHLSAQGGALGKAAPSDCHFRKPPTAVKQLYQLIDIEDPDEFIRSVLEGDLAAEVCTKRSGWLTDVSLQTVRDRLCIMCQKMREESVQEERPAKRRGRPRKGAAAG